MYGIHRIEKRCRASVYGIQIEANRTLEDHIKGRSFHGSDIDWSKTADNVHFVKNNNWNKTITETLAKENIKPRKNSVVLLDSIYTASSEFFEDKTREDIIDYFRSCLEFHEKTYGKFTINAVIHFDETKHGNNVHMHVSTIPIIEKDGKKSLSARDLMGGRDDYRKRQDEFYEQVSSMWGLERGEIRDYGEIRKHINKMEYELQEAKIRSERAKAELNIRERVNKACSEKMHDIEIIKSTKASSITKAPATVTIKKSDFDKMKQNIETAHDLKKGIKQLDEMAKEAMELLSIDERVIKAEREKEAEKAKVRELEIKLLEQENANNRLLEYKRQLEEFCRIFKEWIDVNHLVNSFKDYVSWKMGSQNQTKEEYEYELC